jgi:hypothetical protein
MKKLSKKRLDFHKETIRLLQEATLENAHGGVSVEPFCGSVKPALMKTSLAVCTRTGSLCDLSSSCF